MKLKSNIRVVNSYLGSGTVIESKEQYCKGLWLVQFDKDPPYEYNMSLNPTVIFDKDLKLEVINEI